RASSSANSFRTVEGETVRPARSTRCLEPTGCPVVTYSLTTNARIRRCRVVSSGPSDAICSDFRLRARPPRLRSTDELRRDTAPEETATRCERDPSRSRQTVGDRRQPQPRQPFERFGVHDAFDAVERERLVETKAEHDLFPATNVFAERLDLPRRQLATPQCSDIRGKPRCVPPATPFDCLNRADS